MGIGIDLESISRIAHLIDRYDRNTLRVLFTPNEINQCQSAQNPYQYYTVCFSTKEAVGKALGTGLADIDWNEIEATIAPDRVTVQLYGKAGRQAANQGVQHWLATWCCWDDYVLVHALTY